MVAITVKYHSPTNTRSCRYSATATSNDKRVVISQDDALSADENKDRAALELCKKMPGRIKVAIDKVTNAK